MQPRPAADRRGRQSRRGPPTRPSGLSVAAAAHSSLKIGAAAYAIASPTVMWRAGHTARFIAILNAVHALWSVLGSGCPATTHAPAGVQPEEGRRPRSIPANSTAP